MPAFTGNCPHCGKTVDLFDPPTLMKLRPIVERGMPLRKKVDRGLPVSMRVKCPHCNEFAVWNLDTSQKSTVDYLTG